MTVRKATYSETQKILEHSLQVLKEATMGYIEPTKEKSKEMISPFLSSGGYYLVHVENSIIQGWIAIGTSFDIYTNELVGFIPELYVLPKYRKRQIAEALCKEALHVIKETGHKKVQLNVFSGNQAKHLYKKLGFQEVSSLMEKNI